MEQKMYMNAREAANYLGIALSYLYKLTSKKEIPHYRPLGRHILFNVAEVNKWVSSRRIASNAEVREQAESNIAIGKKGGAR
ncbi:helix-turn-helix domain-containing protein [Prevotella brunnea]|uniref:excisionase family DNA-binding protein n=1 Tax=Prevotella brunnea TaxID=2508867 RepID=UPI00282874CE|nr:excisionase family DNA-binding protein [Prevotella brunnea]MDR0185159.1 helix-turn-helix domain-containing protein [Prevotella brunnea]